MKRLFAIHNVTECCFANYPHNYHGPCPVCGAEIAGHLLQPNHAKQLCDFAKVYEDGEKVSLVVGGNTYKAVRTEAKYMNLLKGRFLPNRLQELEEAIRAAVLEKHGENGRNQWITYPQTWKTRVVFNTKTGRLYQMAFVNGKKTENATDVSYMPYWPFENIRKQADAEAISSFFYKCVLGRIEAKPYMKHSIMQAYYKYLDDVIDIKEKDFKASSIVTAKLPPMLRAFFKAREEAEKRLCVREHINRLFMSLRWPALVNTGLPLDAGKFFKYNKRVYRLLDKEVSGRAATKLLFPTASKPVLNFLRETGRFFLVETLLETFPTEYAEIVCKKIELPNRYNPDFGFSPKTIENNKKQVERIGVRRLFNLFVKEIETPKHEEDLVNVIDADGVLQQSVRLSTYENAWNESRVMSILVMLNDTCRMLRQITSVEEFADLEIPKTSSLKKLHDFLSKEHMKVQHANKVIPYKKKDEEYDLVVDGYVFLRALDTHTIILNGQEMNICVGSYAENAFEKHTNIVFMYKNQKLEMCIEHNGSFVKQAKGHFNDRGSEEQVKAIKKWAEKVGLSHKECYDLSDRANTPLQPAPIPFEHVQPMLFDEYQEMDEVPARELGPEEATPRAFLNPYLDDGVPF
jgi:hypothetical protein